jgi:hypothetical protein
MGPVGCDTRISITGKICLVKCDRFEKYGNWSKQMNLNKISTIFQLLVDEMSKAVRYLAYIKYVHDS